MAATNLDWGAMDATKMKKKEGKKTERHVGDKTHRGF